MRKHIAMMSLAADSIPTLEDGHKTEVKLLHDEGKFLSSIGLQQFLDSSLTKIIKSHSPLPAVLKIHTVEHSSLQKEMS
jgi:hypothetical protein